MDNNDSENSEKEKKTEKAEKAMKAEKAACSNRARTETARDPACHQPLAFIIDQHIAAVNGQSLPGLCSHSLFNYNCKRVEGARFCFERYSCTYAISCAHFGVGFELDERVALRCASNYNACDHRYPS